MKTLRWVCLPTLLVALGCGRPDPVHDDAMHEGKTLGEWIEALNTPRVLEAQFEAVDALVAIGPRATAALISHLEDVDNEIRCGCATALLRIDREAGLDKVLPLLQGGSAHVQLSMALSLIRANVVPQRSLPVLVRLMQHQEYFVRSEAIKALGELGPQSTEAVPALVKLLREHSDPNVRWRAAYTFVRMGAAAAPAVDELARALGDPDHRVREGAAYALGAIGPQASAAEPVLRRALNDPHVEVRSRAKTALTKL